MEDVETYEKLKGNPMLKYKAKFKWLVKETQEESIVPKKEVRYLVPDACKVSVIYQLPKVHKNPSNPPWSTHSQWGWLFICLNIWIGSCSRWNLIELLQGVEVNDNLLASINVNSLYTNIKQQHATEAVILCPQ